MAQMKIRHLVAKKNADGTTRHYWQPSGELRAEGWQPERLSDDEGAAIARAQVLNADVDAWRKGEASPSAPPAVKARAKKHAAGTVSALIADYQLSEFWTRLAPGTRAKSYQWALDAIEAWAGDQPVRGITPPAVQAFYLAQKRRTEMQGRKRVVVETPAKAAAAVRVLRLLLTKGRLLGYQLHDGHNPAEDPGIQLKRQRQPRLWSREHVEHGVAVADRLGWRGIGTFILLNEWLGQREGDVLSLRPWKGDGQALVFQQSKTDRWVSLPLHLVPRLVARLKGEGERPGAVVSAEWLLLNDSTGRKWNEHTFRHKFAEVREAATKGLPANGDQPALPAMPDFDGLWLMELRHTAVTRLHESGVDELGIAGITGHTTGSVKAILDRHYLIRTAKAAEGAFKKRLAAESGEE